MSSAYAFVAAAVLAVIPILIIFKINMEKIKENPTQLKKAQTNLFIGVGLSEVIPILLFVYGLMNLTTVESISDLLIPGLIIILLVSFAVFFIFLQMKVDVEESSKNAINAFGGISLPLVAAVPIMAIVGFFLMMP